MSSTSSVSAGEFEFDDSQNRVIGSLARKMGLVGLVLIFFGVLQMVNGVSSLVMSRNPERMLAAAQKSGFTPEQTEMLKKTFADGSWSSPLVAYPRSRSPWLVCCYCWSASGHGRRQGDLPGLLTHRGKTSPG